MKKIILLVTLMASLNAFGSRLLPHQVLSASLTEAMNIDQDSYLSELNILGGNVEVNQTSQEISLELHHPVNCPPNAVCIEVLLIHEIKLPIIAAYTDRCSNQVYVAKKDMRPVDGALEVLTVTDHTKNRCPTFQILPKTSISYESSFFNMLNGEEVKTHSTFEASKLVDFNPIIFP